MDPEILQPQSYGKREVVELLTGVKNDEFLGYLDISMKAELRIQPEDMPKITEAVMSYKANRIRCYGEEGAYVKYFSPAFQVIEGAMATNDFEKFKDGCELLLDLIAMD